MAESEKSQVQFSLYPMQATLSNLWCAQVNSASSSWEMSYGLLGCWGGGMSDGSTKGSIVH